MSGGFGPDSHFEAVTKYIVNEESSSETNSNEILAEHPIQSSSNVFRGSKKSVPGQKKAKERLTFTACANVTERCHVKLQIRKVCQTQMFFWT